MARIEDETLWGTSLSLAARELPMTISILTQTLQSINARISELGADKLKTTPEGARLSHLLTTFGGLVYMLQGTEAVMNALVLDLMKDVKEE